MKPWLAGVLLLIPALLWAENQADTDLYRKRRARMVESQIQSRGVTNPIVLRAMAEVPRHCFVSKEMTPQAYQDHPLPIGEGQTISQPYIVALMTACLNLGDNDRVLEIGTGSGYQAAILSRVAKDVFTLEIKKKLYAKASRRLRSMGYHNINSRHGDGYFGWADAAPFDAIMITAAVDHIPPPLLKQLKDGGRLVLPLGNPFSYQNLVRVTKQGNDFIVKQITGVLFVPMTGYAMGEKGVSLD